MSDKIIITPDPDLLDLIPNYLKNRQVDIVELKKAFEARDFQHIRSIGHSIKGSGAGYGFAGLTDIGSALEAAAKGGDGQAVQNSITEMEAYLADVQVVGL